MTKLARSVLASILLVPMALGQQGGPAAAPETDPVKILVSRLDLAKFKATVKGLTRFGDCRQGTDRNRAAVAWIEAQLKSYGCAGIARLKYTYAPTDPVLPSGPPIEHAAGAAQGGARFRGVQTRVSVNTDPLLQSDERLRALNSQPSQAGEREEVYCTKVGASHPQEMYIVGAHMDGIGGAKRPTMTDPEPLW